MTQKSYENADSSPEEFTVIHRRISDPAPREKTASVPQNIRFSEVPTFAWITACAFSPEHLPRWGRYALALVAWPLIALIPMVVGLKGIYRTGDFSGVVAMQQKKKGQILRNAARCLPLFLIPIALMAASLLPGIPGQVLLWAMSILPILGLAAIVWAILGVVIIFTSGPMAVHRERRAALESGKDLQSKLAPKGTPKREIDGLIYEISGAAKRIGKSGGVGATFMLVRTIIMSLPEGSFVIIQPRTGTLRAAYARQGFTASGRKDMVFKVPPALPPKQNEVA